MSSFERSAKRVFAPLFLCVVLAACGFEPVYGPHGTGQTLQNRILVDNPIDREGFVLVRRLEERLGRAGDPDFRLGVQLWLDTEDRAIDPDGNIRRYHLIGRATYTLSDYKTEEVLQSRSISRFVGFSATGSTVATLAAQRDAQERLMTILADEIILQLQASQL